MSTEERFSVIEEFQPEMASANCGSMNFCYHKLAKSIGTPKYEWEIPYVTRTYDNVFKNTFQDMEYCIRTMNRCGTLPEYEVFDYGQLANLRYFQKKGLSPSRSISSLSRSDGRVPHGQRGHDVYAGSSQKMLGDDIQYSTVAGGGGCSAIPR